MAEKIKHYQYLGRQNQRIVKRQIIKKMRNLVCASLVLLVLFSCQGEGKKSPDVDSESATQDKVNQLAAFYFGTLPNADGGGIETLLSLNADVERTFTLEERYTDQNLNSKTSGTWTVDGDIVTLSSESGSTKYQVTANGLVSFNNNGSKRDETSAKKYLLRKVRGE
ncbi:copper resistance protein NlpE N-terminal domain-containing protein [Haliscomenobacter hydrossis]|uniref:Lipocalin-like domain-containing protein n=1 Tax=Haliscomenobacter hydrossis (strain ATCC 27775 / DSM 1100 / LMG 10767 / O) TaxID=760192 RepID=F4KPA4_HALH1|nr:copper resistance protein NlpE N-terminal domain-containing protein [Haliscomenobacter hydrossis]AEE48898.1 hypothetical protein Halhy_0999 [Haliscomenobacter hydrossis DSM 1100]